MKTSCWFTPIPPGHAGIGISRGIPAGFEHLPTYRKLAPGPWFKSCSSPARYKDRYFGDTLAKLDPRQVVLELQHLAGEAEPVLLCYEHPPPSPSWCHRALVSVWLFDTLGLVVPELGHEHRGHGRAHPKLHPTSLTHRGPSRPVSTWGHPPSPDGRPRLGDPNNACRFTCRLAFKKAEFLFSINPPLLPPSPPRASGELQTRCKRF